MKRREFITLVGGVAVAWPLPARTQQPVMPVIGYLSARSEKDDAYTADMFRKGVAELGFVPNRGVAIEYRWAEGRYDRLPDLAADLVHRRVSVVAAAGTITTRAAKAATGTIPVVFVTADDPVEYGLVDSLNQPGGNVTGVTMVSAELRPKMLQLLHELVPHAKTIHMLANPTNTSIATQTREAQAAAEALGLRLQVLTASTPTDIDTAFENNASNDGAFMIASDPFLTSRRNQILSLAARHAMPAIYPWREFAVAGGLISYGSSNADGYYQLGLYVGKILKGAKPAELPVWQPTKFELVINLKTAKALGITLPLIMQMTADEVIE